jgi:hypothetical protein
VVEENFQKRQESKKFSVPFHLYFEFQSAKTNSDRLKPLKFHSPIHASGRFNFATSIFATNQIKYLVFKLLTLLFILNSRRKYFIPKIYLGRFAILPVI